MKKEYSNNEIIVAWEPKKCIHARECIKGLPKVFDRERSPWVNMQGASSEEIMKVIDRCPSGALSYRKAGEEIDSRKPAARIKVLKNGPLLVEGSFMLENQDGNEIARDCRVALCRCGGSMNKPFCDGTHAKIGFKDAK
jgi:uncharacterized Fe-S cluster protein YjdI